MDIRKELFSRNVVASTVRPVHGTVDSEKPNIGLRDCLFACCGYIVVYGLYRKVYGPFFLNFFFRKLVCLGRKLRRRKVSRWLFSRRALSMVLALAAREIDFENPFFVWGDATYTL